MEIKAIYLRGALYIMVRGTTLNVYAYIDGLAV